MLMNSDLTSEVHDLKFRLQWGQPGFTIIDVRDRHTYNQSRITGAIAIPLNELVERATSTLHKDRHIYIYGNEDTQAGYAVQLLRAAGFTNVIHIHGGLSAWRTVGGATEGIAA